jgi:hypothetical protein
MVIRRYYHVTASIAGVPECLDMTPAMAAGATDRLL